MAAWMRPRLSRTFSSRTPMSGGLVSLPSATPAPAMPPTPTHEAAAAPAPVDRAANGAAARVAAALFPVLLALYAAFGLYLSNAPMQDLPDHITRAHIIADLMFNHGRQFGDHFFLQPAFSPYIGTDLLLATLDRVFGTAWAARLCIATTILLLPLGTWFVIRKQGGGRLAASTAGVLALYVATDSMFIMGFTSFLLSAGCALFAYGWFCDALRTHSRRSYALFVLLLLLSYAMHLSALIFIIALTGVSALLRVLSRRLSVRAAAALLLPPLSLLLLQVAFSPGANMHGKYWWGTWVSKLSWLAFQACRFQLSTDLPILAAFAAAAAFPIAASWPRRWGAAGAEQLLITAALALLYLITPYEIGIATYLDMRALHYASLFLICAGVLCAELRPTVQTAQLAAASALAVVNLLCLAAWMLPQDAALQSYRLLAREIPHDAQVLPIDTRMPRPRSHSYYDPLRHAGAYITLESHALTPYLFAGDREPHLAYFRYRERPYAPEETWYVVPAYMKGAHVDWQRVQQQYRYLLVTVPWDARKIPVPYTEIARNEVAALLELRDPKSADTR